MEINETGGGRERGGGGVNGAGGLGVGVLGSKVEGFWRSVTASGWKGADPVVAVGGKKAAGGSDAGVEVRLTLAAVVQSRRKRGEGLQLSNGTLYLGGR